MRPRSFRFKDSGSWKAEEVEKLKLDNCNIPLPCIERLKGMTRLTLAECSFPNLRHESVAISPFIGRLEKLWLDHTKVQDLGRVIGMMEYLTELKLTFCEISFPCIERLKGLTTLSICYCSFPDLRDGNPFPCIERLKGLTSLYVEFCSSVDHEYFENVSRLVTRCRSLIWIGENFLEPEERHKINLALDFNPSHSEDW